MMFANVRAMTVFFQISSPKASVLVRVRMTEASGISVPSINRVTLELYHQIDIL